MNTNGLTFFIRDEVVIIHKNEDGELQYGMDSFIVAEADDGRRWRHYWSFPHQLVDLVFDDEGYQGIQFIPNENLHKQTSRLLARITCAEEINLDYWNWTEPHYGSPAWEGQEPVIAEMERREDQR